MRALEFIIESFPLAKAEFMQANNSVNGDPSEVEYAIQSFRALLNKNQLVGAEKDINTWRKAGWEQFKAFVKSKEVLPTKTAIKKATDTGNFITLEDTPEWLIVIPLDMAASAHHGRNTDWCTTKQNQVHFSEYFLNNEVTLIYCINKTDGKKWAVAVHQEFGKTEQFNQKDTKLSAAAFQKQTGMNVLVLRQMALAKQGLVDAGRNETKKNDIGWIIYHTKGRDPTLEQRILQSKNAAWALEYAHIVVQGLWPEGEKIILTNPESAFGYAWTFKKDGWPEGESIIATSPDFAYKYADFILQRRWPEGEAAIAKDPESALSYALQVLRKRFPAGEATIATDPAMAYKYAINIMQKRFPAGEAAIAKDPEYAQMYAALIIKGRWPEGEKAIASKANASYFYANNVLNARFPAGEKAIARSKYYATIYAATFLEK